MTLSLDVIALGVPEVQGAHEFYKSALSPTADEHGEYVNLDMHGTGQVALYGIEALAAEVDAEAAISGFRGYVLSFIVEQLSEVEALVKAAVQGGAKVLKPAKKGLFGGFTAVYQAPDGAIWKLAAPTKKDTGPAKEPPPPTETAALLGVADPKESGPSPVKRSTSCWRRRNPAAARSPSQPGRPSRVATPGTSPTRTAICGRSLPRDDKGL